MNNHQKIMEKQIQLFEKGDILKKYIDNANDTLRLIITKQCNSQCIYCYEEGIFGSTNTQKQNLDLEDFKNIIIAGKALGVKRISIAGGEPTMLFSRVEELIKLCYQEGLLVYLTTNATNKDIIDLAKKYPSLEFRISLDCSSKEQYKYLRGIDVFDQVISVLKKLAELPNEIHINRVITTLENEWEEFNKMIDMLNENGLNKENVYLRLIPSYPSKVTEQLEVVDYVEYLSKHIPNLETPLKQRNLQFMYKFIYEGINIIIRTRGFYSPKCCAIKKKKKCTEGIAYTRINPNGIIQPCFGSFLPEKINHGDSLQIIKKRLIESRDFLNKLYSKK
ncbi:MAG: radical SAM protein [candidate division SR1 bacterium]|nr:radical SAM protein [candidate division SR1 bacterium]